MFKHWLQRWWFHEFGPAEFDLLYERLQQSASFSDFCQQVHQLPVCWGILDLDQLKIWREHIQLEGLSLLELGCGPGGVASQLPEVSTYTGVDFTPKQMAILQNNNEGDTRNYRCFNYAKTWPPLPKFDHVLAIDSLYMLEPKLFVKNLTRVLHSESMVSIFYSSSTSSDLCDLELVRQLRKHQFHLELLDLTEFEERVWKKTLHVGENLRPQFEREGNLAVWLTKKKEANIALKRRQNTYCRGLILARPPISQAEHAGEA